VTRARSLAALAILVAVALTFPRWSPERFWISIATQMLISALFAMSLDVLVGYAGLPSLGHAAFFGTGAYAFAIVAKRVSASVALALPAAMVVAALAALAIGVFSVRASGIFFLMLTLAFAQMLYALAFGWIPLTGGSDGLTSVPRPELIGGANLFFSANFYVFVAAIVILCAVALRVVVTSRFGLALAGVRENERRMRALGYDTTRLKLGAFVVAGAFAGIAGALQASFDQFVAPGAVFVTTSVTALVMVLVGGAGTLIGPALGAIVVVFLNRFLTGVPGIGDWWQSVLGVLFIATVLFARDGLIGVLRRAMLRWPPSS
jgi:branched-chain amino acid transport system permease protein